MALFGKKKKAEKPVPEIEEPRPEEKTREAKKMSLSSGRMAGLYQKLYQWIFSVNLSADVYQIESGEDTFVSDPLPVRGYYHELLEKLKEQVVPSQREAFEELFSARDISRAMEAGRTSIIGTFCANELGKAPREDEKKVQKWYEFRAEWLENVDIKNRICVLSLRHVTGDLDTGRPVKASAAVRNESDGSIDWDATRIVRLDCSKDGMDFEYDIAEDTMYLHRVRGSSEGDRITRNYLASLSTHGDIDLSHESVKTMTNLLRSDPRSAVEQGEVLFRKGGVFGAPFIHYRVSAAPLEDEGQPTWIIGRMEDIEEEFQMRERNQEIVGEIGNMLKTSHIFMYHLNISQGLIFPIVLDESGFHREEKPQRLSEYLQKRIDTGRIAPEAQEEYRKWMENGYLQRKTAQGPFEFEAQVKEMGDIDFRWYLETIIAIKGKPGQFVRWRRDDTEGHMAREAKFTSKEVEHIEEYNEQMLDSLASLVEFRNVESSSHIAKVRLLSEIILEDLRERSPQYGITKRQILMYMQGATMHDIGKITVPDEILNKQGKLTEEEHAIMQRHTTDGATLVDRLNLPGQDELKASIRDVVLHHHERYDGLGYPEGLSGDDISIGVQAISLADVFDALMSERCYKKGFSAEEAVQMILDGECGGFNPCIIESLKACSKKLSALYDEDELIQ